MSYNESLNPNSNYPLMSQNQWDNAPFNDVPIEPYEFDCIITQTVQKYVGVETKSYNMEVDEEDGSVYREPDGVDWDEEYGEQHLDIPELLEALQGLAKEKLEKCKDLSISEKNRLNRLIKEAGGWESTEKSVEEE